MYSLIGVINTYTGLHYDFLGSQVGLFIKILKTIFYQCVGRSTRVHTSEKYENMVSVSRDHDK